MIEIVGRGVGVGVMIEKDQIREIGAGADLVTEIEDAIVVAETVKGAGLNLKIEIDLIKINLIEIDLIEIDLIKIDLIKIDLIEIDLIKQAVNFHQEVIAIEVTRTKK